QPPRPAAPAPRRSPRAGASARAGGPPGSVHADRDQGHGRRPQPPSWARGVRREADAPGPVTPRNASRFRGSGELVLAIGSSVAPGARPALPPRAASVPYGPPPGPDGQRAAPAP